MFDRIIDFFHEYFPPDEPISRSPLVLPRISTPESRQAERELNEKSDQQYRTKWEECLEAAKRETLDLRKNALPDMAIAVWAKEDVAFYMNKILPDQAFPTKNEVAGDLREMLEKAHHAEKINPEAEGLTNQILLNTLDYFNDRIVKAYDVEDFGALPRMIDLIRFATYHVENSSLEKEFCAKWVDHIRRYARIDYEKAFELVQNGRRVWEDQEKVPEGLLQRRALSLNLEMQAEPQRAPVPEPNRRTPNCTLNA